MSTTTKTTTTQNQTELQTDNDPADAYDGLPEHCWKRQDPPFETFYERGEWRARGSGIAHGAPFRACQTFEGSTELDRSEGNGALNEMQHWEDARRFEDPDPNYSPQGVTASKQMRTTFYTDGSGPNWVLHHGLDKTDQGDYKTNKKYRVNKHDQEVRKDLDRFLANLIPSRAERYRIINEVRKCEIPMQFNLHWGGYEGFALGYVVWRRFDSAEEAITDMGQSFNGPTPFRWEPYQELCDSCGIDPRELIETVYESGVYA